MLSRRLGARSGVGKQSSQSAYIHRQGVLHPDLRPEDSLVHGAKPLSLDLWLCDFGGSYCETPGLDGGHLPDPGFFDPNAESVSIPTIDRHLQSRVHPLHDPDRPLATQRPWNSHNRWNSGKATGSRLTACLRGESSLTFKGYL